ncbi:hypothetical protein SLA2020_493420 [Shorea laevis]
MALSFHLQPSTLFLTKFPKPPSILCYFTTATMSNQADPTKPTSENTLQTPRNYPVPLSPTLPPISKNIELTRAMTASSKSGLFTLLPTHVLYHDEWLIAVNKPQGVYCEPCSPRYLSFSVTRPTRKVCLASSRFFALWVGFDPDDVLTRPSGSIRVERGFACLQRNVVNVDFYVNCV